VPTPKPDHREDIANATMGEALLDIRKILDEIHPDGTPGEKLVRICWVIGNLPTELRDAVINEGQNRVGIGWAAGRKPTDW
jgi:hypothetical protein